MFLQDQSVVDLHPGKSVVQNVAQNCKKNHQNEDPCDSAHTEDRKRFPCSECVLTDNEPSVKEDGEQKYIERIQKKSSGKISVQQSARGARRTATCTGNVQNPSGKTDVIAETFRRDEIKRTQASCCTQCCHGIDDCRCTVHFSRMKTQVDAKKFGQRAASHASGSDFIESGISRRIRMFFSRHSRRKSAIVAR